MPKVRRSRISQHPPTLALNPQESTLKFMLRGKGDLAEAAGLSHS